MSECPNSDWVLSFRAYYHGLYVQSVTELALLLSSQQAYAEIEEELTRALLVDYYEETLHLVLLQTLLHTGKFSQAKWHYEKVTSVFYRELGVKPSPAMKECLRLIQGREVVGGVTPELAVFKAAKQSIQQANGAFCCERDVFNVICDLEIRRAERTNHTGQLATLAAIPADFSEPAFAEKSDGTPLLEHLIQAVLRKGDVLCRDGSHQFLVLLPDTTYEQAQSIIQRLDAAAKGKGFLLRRRLQPLSIPKPS